MAKPEAVYEAITKKFTEKVVKKLAGRIEAVILYGSSARKESTSDSDIDILVLGKRESDWKRVSQIAYDMDSENNFSTFISPNFYSTHGFEENVVHGSFFARRVLREGIVLYDDGSFQRIRRKVLTTG